MEANNKSGFVSYVIVSDVSDTGQLYYYTGYFKPIDADAILTPWLPVNSTDYTKALKMPFRDEAESLCEEINKLKKCAFKYHVQEHAYM